MQLDCSALKTVNSVLDCSWCKLPANSISSNFLSCRYQEKISISASMLVQNLFFNYITLSLIHTDTNMKF